MRAHRALSWFFLALAAVVAIGALSSATGACLPPVDCRASGSATVTVVDSLTSVRFDQPTTTAGVSAEASLSAARNEFESFQIVVEAGGALSGVEVTKGEPLKRAGGAVIPASNLTIYREVPYPVGTSGNPPSDSEGGPGLWPDALVPARDFLYGERRNAFPVDVPAGEKLVAWIDVLVPRRQASGSYRGSILVRDSSGLVSEVPITIVVRGFSIPSTTSLTSSFGFDSEEVCRAHSGDAGCRGGQKRKWLLASLYARAALENRITLSNPAPLGRPPRSAVERRLFDRYLAPLFAGSANTLRVRGARLTSFNIPWSCIETRNGCLQGWRHLADRYRFAGRLFLFLCDEPLNDASSWLTCRSRARSADRQRPGIRKLVTATIQEARRFAGRRRGGDSFLDRIDILVPIVNEVAGLGGEYAGNQRPKYNPFLSKRRGRARRSLWLYTSCRSHGCAGVPVDSPSTVGWPGYAIDAPPSQARAMGWLAFEYRVSGELYYQTTELLPSAWTSQYESGGNGDGTLFYPGTPAGRGPSPAIGGRHHIPIESIRLKRIRDGREDYEYLRILGARGRRTAAMRIVKGLFGPPSVAMHQTTVDATALEAAREELAAMITGHPPPRKRPTSRF